MMETQAVKVTDALRAARAHVIDASSEIDSAIGWNFDIASALGSADIAIRNAIRDELSANGMRVTKWALSTDSERASLARTAFGHDCSDCGTRLETEADFADHFIISDVARWNFGTCDAES